MAKLLERIIDLLLKGKSKELLEKMQADPDLKKATEDLDEAIANMNAQIAKMNSRRKEQRF